MSGLVWDVWESWARQGPGRRDFYPLSMGISAIGALPAVLAYPDSRLGLDESAAGLKGMSQRSGLDWILTEAELSAAIGPLVKTPGGSIRGFLHPLEWAGGDAAGAAEPAAARRAGLE